MLFSFVVHFMPFVGKHFTTKGIKYHTKEHKVKLANTIKINNHKMAGRSNKYEQMKDGVVEF
jgi:hypothetical protein